MSQDWLGMQRGAMKPELQAQITQLGLDYRLMTQFTSFVAVEDKVVTKDGQPELVQVPVEMPEGVSHEGVFGDQSQYQMAQTVGVIGGVANGTGAGFVTRSLPAYAMKAAPMQAPAPPPSSPMLVPAPVATPKSKSSAQGDHLTDAPKDPERRMLESKLQPALLKTLDCFRKSADGGVSCHDVHAGKVEIMVLLTENSSANARAALQALGFEFTKGPVAQNMVAGVLSVDKLDALANLPFVKFVSFQRR
jgi:Ca-activated chloride channel homolog